MPVIGFLHVAFPGPYAQQLAAFRQGLKQSGYIEGQNVAIEYRWANNENDQLPELAADLVRRQVALIVTAGGLTCRSSRPRSLSSSSTSRPPKRLASKCPYP